MVVVVVDVVVVLAMVELGGVVAGGEDVDVVEDGVVDVVLEPVLVVARSVAVSPAGRLHAAANETSPARNARRA